VWRRTHREVETPELWGFRFAGFQSRVPATQRHFHTAKALTTETCGLSSFSFATGLDGSDTDLTSHDAQGCHPKRAAFVRSCGLSLAVTVRRQPTGIPGNPG
jgi:hypothetical protein